MKAFLRFAAFTCSALIASAQTSPDELIQLIRNNDLATLKSRLAAGAPIESHDSRDTTLLMYAAGFGTQDAVQLLLASGANINPKNQFNNTALIYAAGNYEKARLLVAKGADVKAKTKGGRTPLMIAASCDGCSPIVKLLLEKGADPNAAAEHGDTALMNAAASGDLSSVRLLIAAGANAKAVNEAGNDAIQGAAVACSAEGIRLLLAKGANPNSANTFGGEVKFGKIQLIGLTPLMLATTFCSPEVVKILLDGGANIKTTDTRGMTPLMFAVSSDQQNAAVVRQLLQAGSEVNARSKAGETALDWAQKFGFPPVLSVLVSAGAKNGDPYTAPMRKASAPMDARHSAELATGLVQKSAGEFFSQSGCVGCHHQPLALAAVQSARKAGLAVDGAQAGGYVKMMEGMSRQFQQPLVERAGIGGGFDPFLVMLPALADEGYQPNPVTDQVATFVASFQSRDGSWWQGGIARAPLESGHIGRTAEAIRALQSYSTPGLKAEFDARIARARDYLVSAKAGTSEEAAMQIMGLHWAGANGKVAPIAKALVAAQHADGGWSQNPNLASDAFATGKALWALRETGVLKVSDPVYQKGVHYLLETQWEDGSWYVRSRSPKFQPYFQSGFPFDHDQWMSATATSWAVQAIAPTISKN